MNWIVVAYYCGHPIYEESSKRLIQSMDKFNIPYDVEKLPSRGDWYTNMQVKPTFVRDMMIKHSTKSIVYLDVDAEFVAYPKVFDSLDASLLDNVAVHVLDHSKYRRKTHAPEMLSGTVFLKNNQFTAAIVSEWINECSKDPKLWDQHALQTVLNKYGFTNLPEGYTCIFDYMNSVKNKVIIHHQASRVAKRAGLFK